MDETVSFQIHMVKPCPPEYQHLTVIETGPLKKCVCVCACARVYVCQLLRRAFVAPVGSVHDIFQARILECVAIPFSTGIFPTQGWNPGFPRCRQFFTV